MLIVLVGDFISIDTLLLVLLQLLLENMRIEKVLQLLVSDVDTQLFKPKCQPRMTSKESS